MRIAVLAAAALSLPLLQASIEQTTDGTKPAARLVTSFDGIGVGFDGPQGKYEGRNPSDNSLAVGPAHIVQTVNSRLAIFDKQGRARYGPVNTSLVFAGLGGPCESHNKVKLPRSRRLQNLSC